MIMYINIENNLKSNKFSYFFKEKYCMIRDQITLEKKYNSLGLKCFACKQNHHITSDCPYLHYIPDRHRIIKIHTFNPQQKERIKFSRKPYKTLNALNFKNSIRISYLRFKNFLKKYYIMEEDFLSECSQSLEEISEKDIEEYEKFTKSMKTFEESKISSMNHFPSLHFEKPFISINRINDCEEEQSLKEIKLGNSLVSMTKINESAEEDIEEIKKEKKIIGHNFHLSIDTNSSKSKNIINKIKKRSNSSKKSQINENSFNHVSKRREFSNDSKNEGSMFFNYEGLELDQFQKQPNQQTQSTNSFNLFLLENKSCCSKRNQSVYSFSNINEIEKPEAKNEEILQKFNKQRSLIEQQPLNGIEIKKKNQSFIDSSKEIEKISKKINGEIVICSTRKKKKESTLLCLDSYNNLCEPAKSASLKKFKNVDENDFLKSPLLKLPVYGDNPKFLEKRKKIEETDEKIIDQNIENRGKKQNLEIETQEKIDEEKEMVFETVKNFKNYYPQNNVKQIIQIIANFRKKKTLRNNKKRRKTRKIKSYFNEINPVESRFSFDFNKVVPVIENNLGECSVRFSSPKMQNKRASNIFLDRVETVNFFKKTNKFTFYDVVYEVLNNKDLRKHLNSLREKSYKNKLKSQLTNNHLI